MQTDTHTDGDATSTEEQTATDESEGGAGIDETGLVTVAGGENVEETVSRIGSDVESGPMTLMTTVDHAENAASVDAELPPTTLLLFGNPEIGTPLMQSERSVAIDLPQKMLVCEAEDGSVNVTYNDPEYLANRHGIEGQEERIEKIASALNGLATGEQ